MKRIIVVALILLGFAFISNIFCQCVDKCEKKPKKETPVRTFKNFQGDLKLGIGILPTFFMDGNNSTQPPIMAAVDVFAIPHFSFGILAGHSETEMNRILQPCETLGKWKNSFYFTGIRLNAHYTKIDNWNIYGGFMIGIRHSDISSNLSTKISQESLRIIERSNGIPDKKTSWGFTGILGVQYAFTKNLSVWSEFGAGVSLINLGVGYRIF